MEEENVSDEGHGDGLSRSDEQPSESPHSVEGCKVRRESRANRESEAPNSSPEQDRCTTDDGGHGNPDKTA